MYRRIDPDRLLVAINLLHLRLTERFPDAGLAKVCAELNDVATEARARSEWISRPVWWLRVALVLFVVSVILVGFATTHLRLPEVEHVGLIGLVGALEAAVNAFVLIGAAVIFLVTIEARWKRSRALEAIHELRALAHVVDMHQLTKDPDRLLEDANPTQSSPELTMTRYQLTRYLSYSSEMLSLIGKVAALYAQCFQDSVALAAVNEVESLCSGLSHKIWQKSNIIHTGAEN